MAVRREDVLAIAALARLRVEEREVERLADELNGILRHVGELAVVEPTGASVVEGAADWAAPLRAEDRGPDELEAPPSALAPDWREGFFVVPRLAALDTGES